MYTHPTILMDFKREILFLIIGQILCCVHGAKEGKYTAAVFDQAPPITPPGSDPLTREEALQFLEVDIRIYEEQCAVAHEQVYSRLLRISCAIVHRIYCLELTSMFD